MKKVFLPSNLHTGSGSGSDQKVPAPARQHCLQEVWSSYFVFKFHAACFAVLVTGYPTAISCFRLPFQYPAAISGIWLPFQYRYPAGYLSDIKTAGYPARTYWICKIQWGWKTNSGRTIGFFFSHLNFTFITYTFTQFLFFVLNKRIPVWAFSSSF